MQSKTFSTGGWLSLAILTIAFGAARAQGQVGGGRHVGPDDSPPPRQQAQVPSQDSAYGRAVIYRAGEMPRKPPPEEAAKAKKPSTPVRTLHFLDTTLPVLIQGMPQHWWIRRIGNMG
jgi:hypothetical protein